MVNIEIPQGTTPLDPDEAEALLPTHITTRGELDQLEQLNIAEAEEWTSKQKITAIAQEAFLQQLHKKMFSNVWRWAGEVRTTEKNFGSPTENIRPDLRNLCNDVETWIEHSSYEPDEMAARFHHQLVSIHPFPNGNGRHARLATDLLLERNLSKPRFSWGGANLSQEANAKTRYIAALQAADKHDYQPLLAFVRS